MIKNFSSIEAINAFEKEYYKDRFKIIKKKLLSFYLHFLSNKFEHFAFIEILGVELILANPFFAFFNFSKFFLKLFLKHFFKHFFAHTGFAKRGSPYKYHN